MFHIKCIPEKSLNRLVLVRLIFKFFLITMYEIDTAAEVYLEPFQTYMVEPFFSILTDMVLNTPCSDHRDII